MEKNEKLAPKPAISISPYSAKGLQLSMESDLASKAAAFAIPDQDLISLKASPSSDGSPSDPVEKLTKRMGVAHGQGK